MSWDRLNRSDRYTDTAVTLLAAGADPTIRNRVGKNVFNVVASSRNDVLRMLLAVARRCQVRQRLAFAMGIGDDSCCVAELPYELVLHICTLLPLPRHLDRPGGNHKTEPHLGECATAEE